MYDRLGDVCLDSHALLLFPNMVIGTRQLRIVVQQRVGRIKAVQCSEDRDVGCSQES